MPRNRIEFREMTAGEIEIKIAELKQELFNLRFRNTMRQLDNPLTIRYVKRDLARCKTALAEYSKGIRQLAGGDADQS